ncbi:hypothetical protein ERX35_007070 [Macrococcus equipercicus]|uniref:Uncharacterized protein n=1 Tax=Macrococcus equipercicus TaxID=69967 RepID=A0ABQ6R885_9STAP|nr:hypothetical protein [Macrococcus equipercicus]KAA1039326.1 hypothetical protein ERX35_007070 [Macrococcus equipercicus]
MELLLTILVIAGVLYIARRGLTIAALLGLMLLHRVLLVVLRVTWYHMDYRSAAAQLLSPWTLIVLAALISVLIAGRVTQKRY